MTTSTKFHRPAAATAVTVVALIGALSASATNGAHAIPDRLNDAPAVLHNSLPTPRGPIERPCFLTRATWNEALDGPQPRCFTDLT